MEKFINPIMGIISGLALMSLNTLGDGIINSIIFRVTGGGLISNPLVSWGFEVICIINLILSLIGMGITILFTFKILKILIKTYRI
ncbi:MAG: hypothetical protein ACRCYC_15405 [Paraclostridium sp.]|uniref:hypothetical protein n=1 Tax=Paraclostridium sp. TaxID=2023273 RepID=UPI003F32BF30